MDNSTALLVVQEKIPKSNDSVSYGLILGYGILSPNLCKTILNKGMLNSKGKSLFFTPDELKKEWDIIDEERQESILANPIAVSTSPLKKGQKQKSIAGAPGDKMDKLAEKKPRKPRAAALSIHKCVNMTDVEINMLVPTEMKAMNALYKQVFSPMYAWGKKLLTNESGEGICVHYKYLHRAPPGRMVYRSIHKSRLQEILNRVRIDGDYHSEYRLITVLPLKLGPFGPEKIVEFFNPCLPREKLTSTTHYYIIGRQHMVEAHRILVEIGEIPKCDKDDANTFNIIPLRAYSESLEIMHLSKALNQNIASEQKEQTFLTQLVFVCLKWRDMGSPQPSFMKRTHSKEYLVPRNFFSTIYFFLVFLVLFCHYAFVGHHEISRYSRD